MSSVKCSSLWFDIFEPEVFAIENAVRKYGYEIAKNNYAFVVFDLEIERYVSVSENKKIYIVVRFHILFCKNYKIFIFLAQELVLDVPDFFSVFLRPRKTKLLP